MNVVELIVKNDYCIGCGVCASVCPSNNLFMRWSKKGELIPDFVESCKSQCSICLDVCPFNNHEINQDNIANVLYSKIDDINYNKYTGYYVNCFVGFQKDEEKRLKSASGGLATAFLSSLLEENIVDKIIAVGISDENPDRMFDYKILGNSEDIYSCAGSAYYPVEISRVLKKILNEKIDQSYAIIALPCLVYSLRLAIAKMPKLNKKVKIIASLTCGQLQNRFCTELLSLESGIEINELSTFDFRRKDKKNYASNFLQVAIDKRGNEGIAQPYKKLPFYLWYYQFFKQNACNYCDDVFGELADVTFMDAWLPEYKKDYKGTSLVITRTHLTSKIVDSFHESSLIDSQKVIKSQEGIIKKKRELLRGRLYEKNLLNSFYPKKRVSPNKKIYEKNKEFIELTSETQQLSKEIWPEYRTNKSTTKFWKHMEKTKSKIRKYRRKTIIYFLLNIPFRLFKKTLGLI